MSRRPSYPITIIGIKSIDNWLQPRVDGMICLKKAQVTWHFKRTPRGSGQDDWAGKITWCAGLTTWVQSSEPLQKSWKWWHIAIIPGRCRDREITRKLEGQLNCSMAEIGDPAWVQWKKRNDSKMFFDLHTCDRASICPHVCAYRHLHNNNNITTIIIEQFVFKVKKCSKNFILLNLGTQTTGNMRMPAELMRWTLQLVWSPRICIFH